MLVVPYDGFTRLSEVTIESIPLWIRVYDIPVVMQIPPFLKVVGAKVGRVPELGKPAKDFFRIRVEFVLEDALKQTVLIKVKDRGLMEFVVKYENIPHFCFVCSRIGNAERDCPDEDLQEDGLRFDTGLCTSPFKREMGRRLAVHTAIPSVRRGLNFSGQQRECAASFSASSAQDGTGKARGRCYDDEVADKQAEEIARGVQGADE
ncbi:unnamed protein product [Urochloa humidicola]